MVATASTALQQSSLSAIWQRGASFLSFKSDRKIIVPFNVLSAAKLLAAEAYLPVYDKGTEISLWMHIHEVEKETALFSGTSMSQRRYALATLHELFEITKHNKPENDAIYTPEMVLARGFDVKFVDGVSALRRFKNEPYLAYIHRASMSGDMDAIAVKIADLRVNQRMREHKGDMSPRLLEKKAFLYPVSEAYLLAVYNKEINPRITSPMDFVNANASLARLVPDAGALSRHSIDNVIRVTDRRPQLSF